MTKQAKQSHTPTPWQYKNGTVYDKKGEGVLNMDIVDINGPFIVRACNSHKETLNALKDLKVCLEGLYGIEPQIAGEYFGAEVMDRLESAIAKAESKI